MATPVIVVNNQMGASGANHAAGYVPDPGATAGTTRFLREDATFFNISTLPYVAKTANYTADAALDYQIECTANSFTVTLPTAVGIQGKMFSIKNSGTGTITVTTTSSQTIDGQLTQLLSQYDNLVVMSNNVNWIIT